MNRLSVKMFFFNVVLALALATAWGGESGTLSRFSFNLPLDASLSLSSVLASVVGNYRYSQMEVPKAGDVREVSSLLPWDRPVAGRYSKAADRWSRYAAVLGAAPLVMGGVSVYRGEATFGEWGSFTLMFAEALALQNGINLWVRSLEIWPRPYIYAESGAGRSAARRARGEAYGSFFSGHASSAFTVAFFASEWFSEVYPQSAVRPVVTTGLYTLAAFVGVLRVAAGKHYPSDVVAGALVGTGVSWGVLQAHRLAARISGVKIGFGVSWTGAQVAVAF